MPSVGRSSTLHDVAAISMSDVWAVGDISSGFLTLGMHFDGRSWSVVPTPSRQGSINELFGVAAAASNDVWAVGVGGPEGPLVLHWEGTIWSEVPTPSPGSYGGYLFDVAVVAPNDVWAVGFAYTAPAEENESATLTEHWDGDAWTIVPSPSAFSSSSFRAVSADSSSDVWALGVAEVDRWDGSAWNLVSSVPQSWNKFFTDIAVFAPDDVWVSGYRLFPETQPAFTHWNGTAWESTVAPVPDWGETFGIGGPRSDSLWAVGQQSHGVLMERWNGTSWQVVPVPSPPGSTSAILLDVVVDPDGIGWAVGATGGRAPLIEHTCRP